MLPSALPPLCYGRLTLCLIQGFSSASLKALRLFLLYIINLSGYDKVSQSAYRGQDWREALYFTFLLLPSPLWFSITIIQVSSLFAFQLHSSEVLISIS